MAGTKPFALRARVILPLSQPAIEDGAVFVLKGRIAAIGRWRDLRRKAPARVHDLGEAVLLPGLINSHCHLDYTDMAGAIPPPRSFLDWIEAIIAIKAAWDYSDYAESWLRGAHQGAVSREHLQGYLDEFAFRFNRRRNPMAAFQTLLGLAAGVHGPTTYHMLYRSESTRLTSPPKTTALEN